MTTLKNSLGSPSRTRTETLLRARDFKYAHALTASAGPLLFRGRERTTGLRVAAFTQSFTQSEGSGLEVARCLDGSTGSQVRR